MLRHEHQAEVSFRVKFSCFRKIRCSTIDEWEVVRILFDWDASGYLQREWFKEKIFHHEFV